jgi:hypothetical protein
MCWAFLPSSVLQNLVNAKFKRDRNASEHIFRLVASQWRPIVTINGQRKDHFLNACFYEEVNIFDV